MKGGVYSVLFMFVLTLAFTALVGGVRSLSQDRIERNQDLKLQRVILDVLGLDRAQELTDQEVADQFAKRVRVVRKGDRLLYLALEKGRGRDKVVGAAFPVGGQGFWGPIKGIVAVDPQGKRITGLAFYKHNETPGLGGRMTEPWFQNQFKGLTLRPLDKGRKTFFLKPAGTSQKPEELDAITGATQSSQAIERFLNKELDYFLKNMADGLDGRTG